MSDDHEVFFALAMAVDHDEFHQARALRTWWPRIQSWYERLTKFESQQICACRFERRDWHHLAKRAIEAEQRLKKVESVLSEVREFIEGQSDVVDGPYGIPKANRAMQLSAMMTDVLGP